MGLEADFIPGQEVQPKVWSTLILWYQHPTFLPCFKHQSSMLRVSIVTQDLDFNLLLSSIPPITYFITSAFVMLQFMQIPQKSFLYLLAFHIPSSIASTLSAITVGSAGNTEENGAE